MIPTDFYRSVFYIAIHTLIFHSVQDLAIALVKKENITFTVFRFMQKKCKLGYFRFLGQKFALMELKSLIGRILYDYKLEPQDRTSDMRILMDLIIRPIKPVKMKFIKI